MALNCPNRGSDGEPCGVCDSCSRIWGGQTALDVIEIDAASNRGVDDARDLRERAMYAPSEEGRFKVYIVDEAHMLTREAWNALLKVLEEPPPRVIFIFATTEPQKIQQSAAPILSRCQRFDFRRIGVSDIAGRMREVLTQEGIDAGDDALRTIARRAEGGMRDGLSMLDQVLALTGGEVGSEAVRRVLGLVEEERYLELLDILAGRRHGEVFTFLEGLLDEGYDLVEFYHGWVEILRTVLRVRLGGAAPDIREDLVESFRARAEAFSPGDLVRMLSLSSELESTGSLRRSGNPRVILEMLLLRLSYLDHTVELEALIRRLGGAPAPSGDAGAAGFTPPAPRGLSARGLAATTPSRGGAPAGGVDPSVAGTRSVSAAAPPPSAPASAETRPASPRSLELTDAWRALASGGRSIPSGLGLFLRAATVREEPPGSVRVALSHGPARERLEDPLVRRALSDALSTEVGRSVTILLETEPGAPEGEGAGRVTAESVRAGRLRDLLALEPLLGQAVKELDLELLE
jgi:DNA polymerase-3 subunit gamma/tau